MLWNQDEGGWTGFLFCLGQRHRKRQATFGLVQNRAQGVRVQILTGATQFSNYLGVLGGGARLFHLSLGGGGLYLGGGELVIVSVGGGSVEPCLRLPDLDVLCGT